MEWDVDGAQALEPRLARSPACCRARTRELAARRRADRDSADVTDAAMARGCVAGRGRASAGRADLPINNAVRNIATGVPEAVDMTEAACSTSTCSAW
jgi:hypothetical protein